MMDFLATQGASRFYLGVIAFFASVGFFLYLDLFTAQISASSDNASYINQNRRNFDPLTILLRAPAVETAYAGALPNDHNSTMNDGYEEICIASVDDGMVTASAVVDVTSIDHVELALPYNYETDANTECIHFNELIGREKITRALDSKIQHKQLKACDRKAFQPGYYDHNTGSWHDTCTGSQPIRPLPTTAESCPMLSRIENDVWVSFVGDSVTRQYFDRGASGRKMSSWSTGRNDGIPDWSLFSVGGPQGRKIWLSRTFDFVIRPGESKSDCFHGHVEKPFTWGDFVRLREAGPRDDDPQFSFDKMPDIVFYSGGYHAAFLISGKYGAAVEEALIQYDDTSKAHNVPMPEFHLLLNVMPATYLIPKKYTADRPNRTMLNEYRKNLAVISIARKYDFVKSVVDAFSIELAFHDNTQQRERENDVHRDAVHINEYSQRGRLVLDIIWNAIMDRVCSN